MEYQPIFSSANAVFQLDATMIFFHTKSTDLPTIRVHDSYDKFSNHRITALFPRHSKLQHLTPTTTLLSSVIFGHAILITDRLNSLLLPLTTPYE